MFYCTTMRDRDRDKERDRERDRERGRERENVSESVTEKKVLYFFFILRYIKHYTHINLY